MTQEQVQHATGANTSNTARFLQSLNDTCDKYGISSPIQQLCFLAQVGHESGGLYYTEELASGSAYEGRADLNNTQPGDGVRFKGRGLIQITGRSNYTAISNDLGIDCVNDPTLLGGKNAPLCTPDQLANAALTAGWFWNKHNINSLAAQMDITAPVDSSTNLDLFQQITRRINGGTNGLSHRVSLCVAGQPYFTGG